MARLATLLLASAAPGCAPAAVAVRATPWPEADALFRSDPRWLGGDGAFSVDLDDGRILWLFGDSFVATSDAGRRSESVMVRNSVAIQRGDDPASAEIAFHWREVDGRPASFFPDDDPAWYWPAHGARAGETLILFLARVLPDDSPDSLGFRADGWIPVRVDGWRGDPSEWAVAQLPAPEAPFDAVVGVSVLALDDAVYAYVVAEPGSHDLFLLRWTETAFAAGELTEPEWWLGRAEGFGPLSAGAPARVMAEGSTELSVSPVRGRRDLVEVQSRGFGSSTIALRVAPAPEGPWTELQDVFRPSESGREDALVYAGKGHPELDGADLVVTYAANAWSFATLVSDESLYYPRFVRLTFE